MMTFPPRSNDRIYPKRIWGSVGGFSLSEVLVSCAVIIMLVALSFPAYQKIVQASYGSKCSNNLRQIASAGLQNAAERGGRLPDMTRWYTRKVGDQYSFFPYLGLPATGQDVTWENSYTCPVFQRILATSVSPIRTYGINRYATGSVVDNLAEWERILAGDPPQILQKVEFPSKMAFFMDGNPSNLITGGNHSYSSYMAPNLLGSDQTPHLHGGRLDDPVGGLNVVFLDGHVERITSGWIAEQKLATTRTHLFWGARK